MRGVLAARTLPAQGARPGAARRGLARRRDRGVSMRRHLNTLYVTTDGAYVRKDGANVVVEVDGAERMRVPVHMLGAVVAFGRVGLSPALMGHCLEEGVAITHLSENGRFLARVEGPVSGNVLLRREQYRRCRTPAPAGGLRRCILVGNAL